MPLPAPRIHVAGNGQDWLERARALADALRRDGIADQGVLGAVARVPRHLFVPEEVQGRAYDDNALPIGAHQTISQPFVVAYMTELLALEPGHRVLEVGTGSGYQAAILAELGAEVYSIEIIEELSVRAGQALQSAGYGAVHLRVGDGWEGWPEAAPYDAVVVTAAAREEPAALLAQLAPGGRLVIPLEDRWSNQWIWRVTKTTSGELRREKMLAVRFVPMTGRGPGH